jgi:glycosyltransferase involved in cell wall biosynthesis
MRTSVLILNYNELDVSKDSVRLLLKEPVLEVILIDQNSEDGSKEYFSTIKDDKFTFLSLPKNNGSSVGRNAGIDIAKGKYCFLLDGDIMYVRGTIAEYEKILDLYPDAFCVGQNSMKLLNKYGHNGTPDPIDADLRMSTDYIIDEWFPMAWTQYGLFRGDLLREVKFIEEGVYSEAGWGGEDDYLYHEMKEKGYVSLAVDKPIYYHMAHSGLRELAKAGLKSKVLERVKILEKRWGRNATWAKSTVKANDYENRKIRPNPSP